MITLVALSTTLFTSCLKDDEKLFPEKSAERISAAMDEAAKMLPSAEYGWVMEQYAEQNHTPGGYAFCVRFDETTAYVSGELARTPQTVAKSLWKMTNDGGPTLTLDTYNEIFHYLATPSMSNPYAYYGDVEYMVMKVTPDLITLRGKKTENTMYLRRLTEPAEQYLTKLAQLDANLILKGFKANVKGHDIDATLDMDNREIYVTADGKDFSPVPYCPTSTGIRLYEDVKIADDVALREVSITVDPSEPLPTAISFQNAASQAAEQVTAEVVPPTGWHAFSDYPGTYELHMKDPDGVDGIQEVTLVDAGDGQTLWMTNVSENFDLKLTYSRSKGNISLLSQLFYDKADHKTLLQVEVSGKKYYLGTAMFSLAVGQTSGYISYKTTVGLETQDVTDGGPLSLKLVDNGKWVTYKARCLRMYPFTSTSMSSTTRNTSVSLPSAYRFSFLGWYSMTFYHPTLLVKTN